MAGLNPELDLFAGTDKASPHHIMESIGDSNVDKTSDDASLMHFPANWPMPASGLNSAVPTQFTIIFNGSTFVYDGIPAEKVQEIMLIAVAYAKSAEVKVGTQSTFTPLIPTSPSSSPQGNSNNLASQQSACFPQEKSSSICRLEEFPLARRQSLQRFLEKRRDRLCSKAPYASSRKVAGNIDNNFYASNPPDLVSFKPSNEGFHASIAAS